MAEPGARSGRPAVPGTDAADLEATSGRPAVPGTDAADLGARSGRPAESGTDLAAEQAALVQALLTAGPGPAGFDPVHLAAAREALARKRQRSAAAAWPALAAALGEGFPGQFAAYAATHGLPAWGGPLADGRAFVEWLAAAGSLPPAGRLQAHLVDTGHRRTPAGLLPRRRPSIRAAWLGSGPALLLALWWPGRGLRWLWLGRNPHQVLAAAPAVGSSGPGEGLA